jgi:tripartite-type tricarboxylate transporter receptor subunit TctC
MRLMFRRKFLPLVGGIAALPLTLRPAYAWPDQSVRMVVPYTPGTGPDTIGRFVAERLQPKLGQPVVVENVPGASGNIGSTVVARARPDGYTIMSQVNTLVINPSLYKNMPYDPVTDFAPIGMTAWGTLVLVAHPDQKPASLAEFIAAAKAAPRSVTYGSPGVGTPHHLSMALIETEAGIELLHVPYKGSAGALQDNLSGQIPYTFQPVHVAATYIRTGKLKAIAVGSAKRHPLLPEVPTLIEQGLKDADVDMWYGLFAPRDTPAAIVAQIDKELIAILKSDDAKESFAKQGLVPATSTPAELSDLVKRDLKRWADIIAKRGIKAE